MWIPYCTSHFTAESAKAMAKELRASGEYSRVKLGSYLKEEGKTYCKVYVFRRTEN